MSRRELTWKTELRKRIARLPRSAPFCQRTQHWDKREDSHTRVTAFIVNGNETHVIIVQEISRNYNLPGGRLKVNENAAVGIFREICEEVGLQLRNEDIATIQEYPGHCYFIRLFERDIDNIPISAGGEIDRIIWWPVMTLLDDIRNDKYYFAKSTVRLLPSIESIINDISKSEELNDLKDAVSANDLDYVIANIKYYPQYQIDEVIPIAVYNDSLKTLDFLLSYSRAPDIEFLLDMAIKYNYKDIVEYLIENYRTIDLLRKGLTNAVYHDNFVLAHYFVVEGAPNIKENVDRNTTSLEMRNFLRNYL